MSRPIIIDCDTGQDDAIALLLALASPELDILGITTVAGNAPVNATQRNTRLICELVGADVNVYAGCESPLDRTLVTAKDFHGAEGLNGIEIYEPKLKLKREHAVSYLIKSLEEAEANSITLVCIGPLTNIALAFIQAPHITHRINELVIMGGAASEGGNITPAAEFNFYVDPHAANVVLECGRPISLFGLDVTHQARVSKAWRSKMDDLPDTPATRILKTSVDYLARAYKKSYASEGALMHDVFTVAYLLEPELFEGMSCNVTVETTSELTMGASVVDKWGRSGRAANATWMSEVDVDGLFELLLERVARL